MCRGKVEVAVDPLYLTKGAERERIRRVSSEIIQRASFEEIEFQTRSAWTGGGVADGKAGASVSEQRQRVSIGNVVMVGRWASFVLSSSATTQRPILHD